MTFKYFNLIKTFLSLIFYFITQVILFVIYYPKLTILNFQNLNFIFIIFFFHFSIIFSFHENFLILIHK